MKKLSILLLGALATTFVADAVPAKKGLFTFTQPDGSTISAQIVGDEFSHYYVTEDNVPLLQAEDGSFRYASVDASGKIALSNVFAQDIKYRSAEGIAAARIANLDDISNAVVKRNSNERRIRRVAEQQGMGLFTGNYPRSGKVRGLVFLVQYADVSFKVSNPKEFFNSLFNEEGFSQYNATGSVRDYFLDQSNGQFDVTFDICDVVTLSNKRSYYGGNDYYGNDKLPEEMAIEAAAQLADQIDFSQYDFDGDGNIDNVFVVYAGEGEATGGPSESVWPHSFEIENGKTYNGKKLYGYCCVNEWGYDGTPTPIGVFVHEFSHVMGLPDLYHTLTSSANYTPGEWSVLDYGPYNNEGRTPPAYSAYERNAMGWLDPVVLDGPTTVCLEEIQASNKCYLIPTNKTTEFYLLENRQLTGWDKYLPGHGMLIWHIDFIQNIWDKNEVNNKKVHQYVDIVEANNTANNNDLTVLAGYTYPGTSNNTAFTKETTPALVSWSGKRIEMPITDITETENGLIIFNAAGGVSELNTPEAPTLTSLDEGKIEIKWTAVENTSHYLVNMYTKDGDTKVPFGEYTNYIINNGTSIIIEGVQGFTEYFATITAAAGNVLSAPSAESSVVTDEVSIEFVSPSALGGSFSENGEATFNWHPVKDAVKYLLTVEGIDNRVPATITLDFGSGSNLTIPQGWSWSGTTSDRYSTSSSGYYGESAPSAKFCSDGMSLTTPVTDGNIASLSFWLRGANAGEASSLDINGRDKETDSWSLLTTISSINKYNNSPTILTLANNTGAQLHQLQFVYNKASGNLAFDDLTITLEAGKLNLYTGLDHSDVGNVSSYNTTLNVDTDEIRFYVEAVNADGNTSKPSNVVTINRFDNTAVDVIEVADNNTEAVYYNLQGIRVVNPESGLYIRRQGNTVSKVYIK